MIMALQENCLSGVDLALTLLTSPMNRRHFLSTILPALSLVAASSLRAEILRGPSAKMHGQRDRAAWNAAQRLRGVRLAKPDEQIQVIFFVDLNCPACANLWRWFDTPERRRWATLWIPIAYMNKTSAGRAAALLRAADPYAALAQNYGAGFDHDARIGVLPEAITPALQEQSSIRNNTRHWKNALFALTPLMLYRNADGTYWQLLGLLPEPGMSGYFSKLAPARLATFTR